MPRSNGSRGSDQAFDDDSDPDFDYDSDPYFDYDSDPYFDYDYDPDNYKSIYVERNYGGVERGFTKADNDLFRAIKYDLSGRRRIRGETEYYDLQQTRDEKKIKSVEDCIKGGARVNVRAPNGFTALTMAASDLKGHMIKELLANGADPNLPDARGNTALHEVVTVLDDPHDQVSAIISILLNRGAHQEIENKEGKTALELCERGNKAVYEWFRSRLVKMRRIVSDAGRQREWEKFQLPDNVRNSSVGKAICSNQKALNRHEVDMVGVLMANNSSTSKVRSLEDCLNSSGREPDFLVPGNLSSMYIGCTPLVIALLKKNLSHVQTLLKKGADPNMCDSHATTPLHLAVRGAGMQNFVQALLDAGADPNIENADSQTAFQVCEICGTLDEYRESLNAAKIGGGGKGNVQGGPPPLKRPTPKLGNAVGGPPPLKPPAPKPGNAVGGHRPPKPPAPKPGNAVGGPPPLKPPAPKPGSTSEPGGRRSSLGGSPHRRRASSVGGEGRRRRRSSSPKPKGVWVTVDGKSSFAPALPKGPKKR